MNEKMMVRDSVVIDKIQFQVVKSITSLLDLGIGVAMSWLPLRRWYRFLRAIQYIGYTICTLGLSIRFKSERLTHHGHP